MHTVAQYNTSGRSTVTVFAQYLLHSAASIMQSRQCKKYTVHEQLSNVLHEANLSKNQPNWAKRLTRSTFEYFHTNIFTISVTFCNSAESRYCTAAEESSTGGLFLWMLGPQAPSYDLVSYLLHFASFMLPHLFYLSPLLPLTSLPMLLTIAAWFMAWKPSCW